MATHLVIGDPHCTPKANNDRFLWAGRLAADIKATHVICMGDFCSVDSLCSYDKAKLSFEGRRFNKDVEHTQDALIKFNRGLGKHRPRKIMILGNHEDRIDRVVQDNPELEGTLSVSNLQYQKYGWQQVPYKKGKSISGIYYTHHLASGITGRPISGENIARTILTKHKVSATVGHCHLLDHAVSTLPSGKKLYALSAGCYLNHEEAYAKETQHLWWSGLIIKHNVRDGEYDLETMEYKRVKQLYG